MIYFMDTCIVNNITQTKLCDRPTVGRSSTEHRPISGVCRPTDDRATIDRYHDEKNLQKVGLWSGDHRATIARRFTDDKTHENRRIGQRNFLLGCFDKKVVGRPKILPKSVPMSATSPDFLIFGSPTVGRTVGLGNVTVVLYLGLYQ